MNYMLSDACTLVVTLAIVWLAARPHGLWRRGYFELRLRWRRRHLLALGAALAMFPLVDALSYYSQVRITHTWLTS